MKNDTRKAIQRGMAGGMGGTIALFIFNFFGLGGGFVLQALGFTFGLLGGWIFAMYADNPTGATNVMKGAFKAALTTIGAVGNTSFDGQKILASVIFCAQIFFWMTMGLLAVSETLLVVTVVILNGLFALPLNFQETFINLCFLFFTTFFIIMLNFDLNFKIENDITMSKVRYLAIHCNPISALFYTGKGLWLLLLYLWKHRVIILRAIGTFFARLLLYAFENAGLAILGTVFFSLVFGILYGYMVGFIMGFVYGALGYYIFKKKIKCLREFVSI